VVNHYAHTLPLKSRLMIKEGLHLIHFGMGNCFLTFGDKYYEYDSNKDVQDKGLTIGGYESTRG
jgi:hypothetical protein